MVVHRTSKRKGKLSDLLYWTTRINHLVSNLKPEIASWCKHKEKSHIEELTQVAADAKTRLNNLDTSLSAQSRSNYYFSKVSLNPKPQIGQMNAACRIHRHVPWIDMLTQNPRYIHKKQYSLTEVL